MLILRGLYTLAAHLHTQAKLSSLKELVIVSSRFRTTRYTGETPAIKLAGKASKLGLLEVEGQDIGGKFLLLVNDKAFAVRQPRDNVGMLLV